MYYIFTDGAASNNGYDNQIAGWAYIIVDSNGNKVHSEYGGEAGRTNNWGELTAAIKGLAYLKTLYSKNEDYLIYTDSAYLLNCQKNGWYLKWATNGWINSKKEPVANRELWEQLIPYFDNFQYEWKKMKAHTNGASFIEKWNNEVDKLAVRGRMEVRNG